MKKSVKPKAAEKEKPPKLEANSPAMMNLRSAVMGRKQVKR